MNKLEGVLEELANLWGGDVLRIEQDSSKYYNKDKVEEILKKHYGEEDTPVRLPENISSLLFLAELTEESLVDVIVKLSSTGEATEEGRWFMDEDNQYKLIRGWLYGYTVEDSLEGDSGIPKKVLEELRGLKEENFGIVDIIRYKDSHNSPTMKWVIHSEPRQGKDARMTVVVDYWNSLEEA